VTQHERNGVTVRRVGEQLEGFPFASREEHDFVSISEPARLGSESAAPLLDSPPLLQIAAANIAEIVSNLLRSPQASVDLTCLYPICPTGRRRFLSPVATRYKGTEASFVGAKRGRLFHTGRGVRAVCNDAQTTLTLIGFVVGKAM
jgi:hypothetical protein